MQSQNEKLNPDSGGRDVPHGAMLMTKLNSSGTQQSCDQQPEQQTQQQQQLEQWLHEQNQLHLQQQQLQQEEFEIWRHQLQQLWLQHQQQLEQQQQLLHQQQPHQQLQQYLVQYQVQLQQLQQQRFLQLQHLHIQQQQHLEQQQWLSQQQKQQLQQLQQQQQLQHLQQHQQQQQLLQQQQWQSQQQQLQQRQKTPPQQTESSLPQCPILPPVSSMVPDDLTKNTPAYTVQHKSGGPAEDSKDTKGYKHGEQGSVSNDSDESVQVKFDMLKEKGCEHWNKREYTQAVEFFSECIRICPSNTIGYTNRATCFVQLKTYTVAEEDCNKALLLDRTNAKALFTRAKARKGLERYQEALSDVEDALKHEQDSNELQELHSKLVLLLSKASFVIGTQFCTILA
ncbi:hypothetical protein EMCRGX_G025830 [Ephydatia muelleri]